MLDQNALNKMIAKIDPRMSLADNAKKLADMFCMLVWTLESDNTDKLTYVSMAMTQYKYGMKPPKARFLIMRDACYRALAQ